MPDIQQFFADVYDIVAQIPRGKVLSYGDIARLAGWPAHSRLAGRAMAVAPASLHLPCHRVVSAAGRLVPHWPQQAALLAAEGVDVKAGRQGGQYVDMRKYRWAIMDVRAGEAIPPL